MKLLLSLMVVVVVLLATTSARPQQQQNPGSDGGWVVKTDQTKSGGTVVRAEGNQQWDVTKDGKVKAEVHGHWERTYGGPNNGQRDRGVGGSIGGAWG
ncbi:uncharacterized protein LOC128983247 [Macrosteles quadrilineatus]|uniref:uncharacterized protein LOC128983247 n=1 Tax=Macrosteles quadrilineatus TaxID=74068 RepID=UPI0023E2B1C9|nr:uncharacterized protein LOC128983247 [Macrosteles quadrilineatus]